MPALDGVRPFLRDFLLLYYLEAPIARRHLRYAVNWAGAWATITAFVIFQPGIDHRAALSAAAFCLAGLPALYFAIHFYELHSRRVATAQRLRNHLTTEDFAEVWHQAKELHTARMWDRDASPIDVSQPVLDEWVAAERQFAEEAVRQRKRE